MLEDVIKEWNGYEVSAMDVYSDMFNLGYGAIQKENEEAGEFKANPIGYWKDADKKKGHYRIMFDDTFDVRLKELQEADFSILNGITYFGRKNVQDHASKMYAMIFDLDGVDDTTLNNFFYAAYSDAMHYPIPNYVVLSGHGVHLYYLFDYPIPLYPNIKIQLKELKYALTEKMWNQYTSREKKKQFQGINQGFRVIGGKTKVDGVKSRAFRVNEHPYSLRQLCDFVPERYRVDESKLWKESKMSLAEAKKKYPEWYESKVLNKEPRGHWTCKEDLYKWWIRQIREGTVFGHRYFGIMCLAIYGVKCGKSIDDVRRDAQELKPYLNSLNTEEPFTDFDIESALECFDLRYVTFPIDDIIKISGITFEKNKRNGRKQSDHLKMARYVRDEINGHADSWINKDGRPTKKDIVRNWQKEHPNGTKAQCIKELKLTKPTVYKWWEEKKVENKPPMDYLLTLQDGSQVLIEMDNRVSEYERMRKERLRLYEEKIKKIFDKINA